MISVRYQYGFWARNRGFQLSLVLIVFTCCVVVLNGSNYHRNILNQLLICLIYGTFFVTHVFWDKKIKHNLVECSFFESGIVFYFSDREERVHFIDIDEIQFFPKEDDLQDEDYVFNMMSSGVRIFYQGKTVLVFRKMKGFREFLARLESSV